MEPTTVHRIDWDQPDHLSLQVLSHIYNSALNWLRSTRSFGLTRSVSHLVGYVYMYITDYIIAPGSRSLVVPQSALARVGYEDMSWALSTGDHAALGERFHPILLTFKSAGTVLQAERGVIDRSPRKDTCRVLSQELYPLHLYMIKGPSLGPSLILYDRALCSIFIHVWSVPSWRFVFPHVCLRKQYVNQRQRRFIKCIEYLKSEKNVEY
jgi:hypothetical protein